VLNLNDVDIALTDYLQREPGPHSQCVADFIIKGLFYRKVKYCRLQMIVLPKDTREGLLVTHYTTDNLAATAHAQIAASPARRTCGPSHRKVPCHRLLRLTDFLSVAVLRWSQGHRPPNLAQAP